MMMNPTRARALSIALTAFLLVGAHASAIGDDRPFLGVVIAPELPEAVSAHLGVDGGAMIAQVVDGSPAAKAGLRRHDVIIGADDANIADMNGLVAAIGKHKVGDTLHLRVRRGAETLKMKVVLAGADGAAAPPAVEKRKPGFLGVQFHAVSPELAIHTGLAADHGVVIDRVLEGSPAAKAGLVVHDIIVRVAGKDVECKTPDADSAHGSFHAIPDGPHGRFFLHPDGTGQLPPGIELPEGVDHPHVIIGGTGGIGGAGGHAAMDSNLPQLIGKHAAGDKIELDIIHAGKPGKVAVVLGARPEGPGDDASGALRPFVRPQIFGKPQSSARGKIIIRGPDGEERVIEIPSLDKFRGAKKRFDRLRDSLKGRELPDEIMQQLEKAIERLDLDHDGGFDILDLDLDAHPGGVRSKTESRTQSKAIVKDGDLHIEITEKDGQRTVTVKRDGKTIADDLPWDKIDKLSDDVRQKVKEAGKNIRVHSGKKELRIFPHIELRKDEKAKKKLQLKKKKKKAGGAKKLHVHPAEKDDVIQL